MIEQSEKKIRNSNIELLRIICMLLIVAHHCALHGGLNGAASGVNKYITTMFIPIGKIVFDCFIVISAWFISDSKMTAKRYIRVWLEILFYNVIFIIIAKLKTDNPASIGIKQFIGSFLPMMGNTHGFARNYFAFMLTVPFLQLITNRLNFKGGTALFIISLILYAIYPKIGELIGYDHSYQNGLTLFIFVYFSSWYFKKFIIPHSNKKAMTVICFSLFILLYGISYYARIASATNTNEFIKNTISKFGTEFYIFNIVAGFCLFYCFLNIKIKQSAIINKIASGTFGVLLIHDHNFFRPVFWNMIHPSVCAPLPTALFIIIFALIVVCIFMALCSVDLLRQYLFEKPLMKSKPANILCEKIDSILLHMSD